ncbi:hypothetical protein [Xanthobacter aminoxidans]|uniref:hypothetical protein n=1 Tax=Xanthobacter aminoxidans TaxID=186280 RepID=UPI002022DB88|nr:hypothetical protein [Xanthobacter aminoxidans]MCL8385862.1 hypothetical protein [Xanthobacter aminoxidans]
MPRTHAAASAATLPAILPTPFEHQPELRVLPVFDEVPTGHMTMRVEDESFHPHLRRGEFAVIDLEDREPAHREIFLFAFADWKAERGYAHALVEARSRPAYYGRPKGWADCGPGFCFGPAEGFEPCRAWSVASWSTAAGGGGRAPDGVARLADGPFRADALARKLVGRVVGVFVPMAREARMGGHHHG